MVCFFLYIIECFRFINRPFINPITVSQRCNPNKQNSITELHFSSARYRTSTKNNFNRLRLLQPADLFPYAFTLGKVRIKNVWYVCMVCILTVPTRSTLIFQTKSIIHTHNLTMFAKKINSTAATEYRISPR